MRLPPIWTLACLGATALGACHRSPPPAAVPAPSVTTASANDSAKADSIARANALDSIARENARADSIRRAQDAARLAEEEARRTLAEAVHFELDQSDLSAADRALLDRKAAILSRHRDVRVRVEGHADDRGSDEYNLALGMRRAAETRRYLLQRGVDAAQIETVSNGEERPVCQEHEETCWSRNRRAEFAVTAGAERMSLP